MTRPSGGTRSSVSAAIVVPAAVQLHQRLAVSFSSKDAGERLSAERLKPKPFQKNERETVTVIRSCQRLSNEQKRLSAQKERRLPSKVSQASRQVTDVSVTHRGSGS